MERAIVSSSTVELQWSTIMRTSCSTTYNHNEHFHHSSKLCNLHSVWHLILYSAMQSETLKWKHLICFEINTHCIWSGYLTSALPISGTPIADLLNMSLVASYTSHQWMTTVITVIPTNSCPASASDYKPKRQTARSECIVFQQHKNPFQCHQMPSHINGPTSKKSKRKRRKGLGRWWGEEIREKERRGTVSPSFQFHHRHHFWHVSLGVCSTKHISLYSQESTFIQGQVIGFQVLLDSLHPHSTRASW